MNHANVYFDSQFNANLSVQCPEVGQLQPGNSGEVRSSAASAPFSALSASDCPVLAKPGNAPSSSACLLVDATDGDPPLVQDDGHKHTRSQAAHTHTHTCTHTCTQRSCTGLRIVCANRNRLRSLSKALLLQASRLRLCTMPKGAFIYTRTPSERTVFIHRLSVYCQTRTRTHTHTRAHANNLCSVSYNYKHTYPHTHARTRTHTLA